MALITNEIDEVLKIIGVISILVFVLMGMNHINTINYEEDPRGMIDGAMICELVENKECDEAEEYCFEKEVNCIEGSVYMKDGLPSEWYLSDGTWYELWNSHDSCYWDNWCSADSEHKSWKITLPRYYKIINRNKGVGY